jgi:quinol monooxygenase YgiN
MFAAVRHYRFKAEDGEKIDKIIQESFVPLIKKAKGFIRYYWLDTGDGEGASLSVFKDKAGADESIRLAADYVKEHLSKYLTQKPEVIEGPVKAHD